MNFIFQTKRLSLRKFELTDSEFIIELLNSEGWIRFIGNSNVKTVDQAQNYLLNSPLKSYTLNGFGLCMVETIADKCPIGMCGLVFRENLDKPDIGFAFLPAYHGKGYAYEIANATLKYAKEHLDIPEVYGITVEDNHKSISLLNRLGFNYLKNINFSNDNTPLMLFSSDSHKS
ncbi:MAG: GNAT family N-acetyltransferase [Sphingobacteriales bacterium]|nr:MAG: GNAT family N-acetyltransferase [Sphingobacteriales bacterium]